MNTCVDCGNRLMPSLTRCGGCAKTLPYRRHAAEVGRLREHIAALVKAGDELAEIVDDVQDEPLGKHTFKALSDWEDAVKAVRPPSLTAPEAES